MGETLSAPPGPRMSDPPPPDALADMYHLMLVTMLADKKSVAEAKAGRLQAAFYPVRGMEAVCAALGDVLRPEDRLVSTYRNLGDALAKGVPLRSIMAELYGRVEGTSRGKGGPMHLQDQSVGFTATTGVVGSGLPIGVGLAMAAQLDGKGSATVVTFGDGATSIGAYHEAMNFAALWRLPVVLLCQNNQWGEHTKIADYAPSTDLAGRAAAYTIPTERVDGFDPMACREAIGRAVERARRDEGPTFLECVSYRLTGHTGTADFSYVPKDELEAALKRDPAPSFRTWLTANALLPEERIVDIENAAERYVEDAFEYAQSCAFPPPEELYTDVFADDSWVRSISDE
ncbi:thiamine pyrophosphate-dependent dehydrogenase E1 component subunit alpha [Actinomadura sp. LD22]|uniref:Thiamine pyrophosphate-dependent dehydrogenase E1 component subunit alpha n=1 Tax=Actinomadura physcomitrii TaxID=2650748 RepID=A0A6I4MGS9_9ACTN|nr:thiamine pyrophosphate-dependent dehydrogenase E1 component subunit alpha [Actinomadura physcomitrii]MWA03217.1 thiamine pyrophosphate-dependent dehydrogenase E1 component subunit alpha [Actinomadura physcomitrii]